MTILAECGESIGDADFAASASDDGARGGGWVSLGGIVRLGERHESMKTRCVSQEAMCVPVVTPTHDDDIAGEVEPLPPHANGLPIV
jgi:hypothetical protein